MATFSSGLSSPSYQRSFEPIQGYVGRHSGPSADSFRGIRSADDIGSQNTRSFGVSPHGANPALYDSGRGLSPFAWLRRITGDPRCQLLPAGGFAGLQNSALVRHMPAQGAFKDLRFVAQSAHHRSLFNADGENTFTPRSLRVVGVLRGDRLPLPFAGGASVPLCGLLRLDVEVTADAKSEWVPAQPALKRKETRASGTVLLHELAGSGQGLAASRLNLRAFFAPPLSLLPDGGAIRAEQNIRVSRSQLLNVQLRARNKAFARYDVPHTAALLGQLSWTDRLQLRSCGTHAGAAQQAVPVDELQLFEESTETLRQEKACIWDFWGLTFNGRAKASKTELLLLNVDVDSAPDGSLVRNNVFTAGKDHIRYFSIDAPAIINSDIARNIPWYDLSFKAPEFTPTRMWTRGGMDHRGSVRAQLHTSGAHDAAHDYDAGMRAAKAALSGLNTTAHAWWGNEAGLQRLAAHAADGFRTAQQTLPTLRGAKFFVQDTWSCTFTQLIDFVRNLLARLGVVAREHDREMSVSVKAKGATIGVDSLRVQSKNRYACRSEKPVDSHAKFWINGDNLLALGNAPEQQRFAFEAITSVPASTRAHSTQLATTLQQTSQLYASLFGAQACRLPELDGFADTLKDRRDLIFSIKTGSVGDMAARLKKALTGVEDALPPDALRFNAFGVSVEALRRLKAALNQNGSGSLVVQADAIRRFLEPAGDDVQLGKARLLTPSNQPPSALKQLLAIACLNELARLGSEDNTSCFAFHWDSPTEAYKLSANRLRQTARSFGREADEKKLSRANDTLRAKAIGEFADALWFNHFSPDLRACETEQELLDACNQLPIQQHLPALTRSVPYRLSAEDKARAQNDTAMQHLVALKLAGVDVLYLLSDLTGQGHRAEGLLKQLQTDADAAGKNVAVEGLVRLALQMDRSESADSSQSHGLAQFMRDSNAGFASEAPTPERCTQLDRRFEVMAAAFDALSQCDVSALYIAESGYRVRMSQRAGACESLWVNYFSGRSDLSDGYRSPAWEKARDAFARVGERRRHLEARQLATGLQPVGRLV